VIPAPAASPPIVFTPKFLSPPLPPDYPSSAVRRHLQGVVIVRALVSRPGRPDEIVIWRSSGHGVLDAAAEQAVSAWKFVPSHQGGVAVTAWVEVPVVFQLN
jgi:protein TonB